MDDFNRVIGRLECLSDAVAHLNNAGEKPGQTELKKATTDAMLEGGLSPDPETVSRKAACICLNFAPPRQVENDPSLPCSSGSKSPMVHV